MRRFLVAAALSVLAVPALAQQAVTQPSSGMLGAGVGGASGGLSSAPGLGALGSVPGLGGLLGGGDRAKESTQMMHFSLHQVDNAARLAELIKSNENWIIQLMRMEGSVATGFINDFQRLLESLTAIQEETKEIIVDPAGAGQYAPHREFKLQQLDRDMKYLEGVAERMEAVSEDSAQSGAVLSELAATNSNAEGGIQVAQIGNEIALANARRQDALLATMQDILRADIDARARETEEKLLSLQRHCALYPESEWCQ